MSDLLLKFKDIDSPCGVTRQTIKNIASAMNVSETMVIHIALSKLASEVLPAYEMDDGPISDAYLTFLREDAKQHAPKGDLIKKTSLF